ncbi:MAG: DNA internalization-related competence protein ComEC/Rec2 [Gammaproteobacteria bacterium]|nr:DNA internalization-related competence protein ComEC/Rec2 [Gammaproteobacteria bacterium]MDE2459985.1 DNA internalization-related competence protein ComEC/Rec2 [Gammaproteobacteria bacterium]
MGIAGIAMLAGVLAVLALPVLPGWQGLLLVGLPLALLAWWWRPARVLIWLLIGFTWCWWSAQQQLSLRLTPALEGRDLNASGWVASIPQLHPEYASFEFAVEQLDGRAPGQGIPKLLRLSCSDLAAVPAPGQHWQFRVRLKRPHGYMNPGSFDYEGWLFRHGIGATGYVLRTQATALAGPQRFPLLRARATILKAMQSALGSNPFSGVAAALAIGDGGRISTKQWRVFQNTGTAHLVTVSGLHIALVAGLVFLLVKLLWRRSAWLVTRMPVPIAGALAALLAASIYAAMAGFSVPTQRSLIQFAAVIGAVLLRRHARLWDMLGLALIGVLVLNPLSAAEIGFWLSFGAVAAIFYAFSGRLHISRGKIMQLLRTQWAVGIGLLPLLVFFFQRTTLVAPLANLVAVPVYDMLVVPWVLLGVMFLGFWPWAGTLLLKLATGVIAVTWPLLEHLAELPASQWSTPAPSLPLLACAVVGAIWLMLPRRMPARWLGVLLLLPLFVHRPSAIPVGGFNLALLDVGQGLSTVIRTARHTLVYDTGPAFLDSDAGQLVVIPWLRSQALAVPDMTIVSHADNDHAGGLRSLRALWPAMPVLSGAPARVAGAERCVRGQSWEWDGVRFEILSPAVDGPSDGNDASCVLQISGAGGNALLVGDLMRSGEQRLLQLDLPRLGSDVLVVAHHGSRSSSSAEFIEAVAPRFALFAMGYRNRWNFPSKQVLQAYREAGAGLLDTVSSGTLEMRLWPAQEPVVQSRWRLDHAHFWTTQ